MYTKCTFCHSAFEVVAHDLTSAQGMVRCGECKRIFNALFRLCDNLSDPPSVLPGESELVTLTKVVKKKKPIYSHHAAPQGRPIPELSDKLSADQAAKIYNKKDQVRQNKRAANIGLDTQPMSEVVTPPVVSDVITTHRSNSLIIHPDKDEEPDLLNDTAYQPHLKTFGNRLSDIVSGSKNFTKTWRSNLENIGEKVATKLVEFHKKMIEDNERSQPRKKQEKIKPKGETHSDLARPTPSKIEGNPEDILDGLAIFDQMDDEEFTKDEWYKVLIKDLGATEVNPDQPTVKKAEPQSAKPRIEMPKTRPDRDDNPQPAADAHAQNLERKANKPDKKNIVEKVAKIEAQMKPMADPSGGVLREMYEKMDNPFLRAAAVRGIEDEALLCDIALNEPTTIVRIAAIDRLTDQELLWRLAENDANRSIRDAAARKLQQIILKQQER